MERCCSRYLMGSNSMLYVVAGSLSSGRTGRTTVGAVTVENQILHRVALGGLSACDENQSSNDTIRVHDWRWVIWQIPHHVKSTDKIFPSMPSCRVELHRSSPPRHVRRRTLFFWVLYAVRPPLDEARVGARRWQSLACRPGVQLSRLENPQRLQCRRKRREVGRTTTVGVATGGH